MTAIDAQITDLELHTKENNDLHILFEDKKGGIIALV